MVKALVLKELKETAWIWLCAIVAFLLFILSATRVANVPFSGRSEAEIPFVTSRIGNWIAAITSVLAIGLGLWQSYGESWHGTFAPLLNLPLSRRKLFAVKMAVGLGLTWGLAGFALAAICLWAALPGTHASPFEWSMTIHSWQVWVAIPGMYLGSFVTGLLPARWFGSRLFPLVAAVLLFAWLPSYFNAAEFPDASLPAFVALVLLADGVFLAALGFIIQIRDFS